MSQSPAALPYAQPGTPRPFTNTKRNRTSSEGLFNSEIDPNHTFMIISDAIIPPSANKTGQKQQLSPQDVDHNNPLPSSSLPPSQVSLFAPPPPPPPPIDGPLKTIIETWINKRAHQFLKI